MLLAAKAGDEPIVRLLADAGANADIPDRIVSRHRHRHRHRHHNLLDSSSLAWELRMVLLQVFEEEGVFMFDCFYKAHSLMQSME